MPCGKTLPCHRDKTLHLIIKDTRQMFSTNKLLFGYPLIKLRRADFGDP